MLNELGPALILVQLAVMPFEKAKRSAHRVLEFRFPLFANSSCPSARLFRHPENRDERRKIGSWLFFIK